MMDQDDRDAFWEVFRRSPLFADWKGAEVGLGIQHAKVQRPAGGIIFRVDDMADSLYLVGSGIVQETLKHDGVVWMQRVYRTGEYFGQHALFHERHISDAVALTDAELYAIPASELRTALDRNPDLRETLLHEKRASRLRSIPLFRELSDGELARLTLEVQEIVCKVGEELRLDRQPGLYIVDYGQVVVTGPAGFDRDGWRLTAGNFFLTEGVLFGARCAARTARAHLPSRLFYLPAEYSDRLIPAFPDVGRLVATPLDIARELTAVPLFNKLSQEQREHLAQFVGWGFVPEPQNITTQGGIGHSFVILREGAAIATSVDEQGRPRPRSRLDAGQYYGETSLLQGKPRDATVRAVSARSRDGHILLRGADVLTLDRRDLQYAFNERKDLWRPDTELFRRFEQIKESRRKYTWQSEGETIVWDGRRHPLWLIIPEAQLALAGVLLFLLATWNARENPNAMLISGIIIFAGLVLSGGWIWYDFFDDYYVVTNRRVARRDRIVLLFTETLLEAPIETVQDANIKQDFWGRFFDYGDLTIRTAAKTSGIEFRHVPEPEKVKRYILEGKAVAATVQRGQQREIFRRNLMAGLRMVLMIPERQRALGDVEYMTPQQQSLAWLRRLLPRRTGGGAQQLPRRENTLPVRMLLTISKPLPARLRKAIAGTISTSAPPPEPGQNIWRKHPLNLLMRAWIPLVGLAVMILAVIALPTLADLTGFSPAGLLLPWGVLTFFFAGWLWWRVEDYLNDLYIVTDEKIIDIEMKPLGLDYNRREGSLERVQTVNTVQKGIVAKIFDYGNVIIRTAAEGEAYDFIMVPNPSHVQQVIFQKMDALRQRQEVKRFADQQRELIDSLRVYDELRAARERQGGGMM
ncbi:MAG: cyclic nucleotide-binding domain-containing protein [Anaerolineae bacterium]|nr:cyclic nucleotide-binding domain-containing protein [Anaerolineae bacterium]